MQQNLPSFAESPDGKLYVAYGYKPMQVWDGIASGFIDAGVPKPSGQITVASSTSGVITGDRYAYQRWLDAEGKVSSLSPLSAVHTPAISSGTITSASNSAPITITSAAHGLSNGDTVKITGVQGNDGANGVWVVKAVTTNTFQLTDSIGSGDYTQGGTWKEGAGQLDFSGFTVPTDDRVTRRQILINKDGDTTVFFIAVDDTTLSGTTATWSDTDDDFTTSDAVALLDTNGDDLNLTRHGEPPADKRFLAFHGNRLFGAGYFVTKTGAVKVTNGSATVVGIGTEFTSSMVGWYLKTSGSTTAYEITAINTSTQTLTVGANYSGTSDEFLPYSVQPDDDEYRRVEYSESALFESWNPTNGFDLTEDPRDGDITGLMSFQAWLFILTENFIHRLTFGVDPDPIAGDGGLYKALSRGCLNHRCWTIIEDKAYLLDRKGAYTFDGQAHMDISGLIQSMFSRDNGTAYTINWNSREFFFCEHFPDEEVVRWFVSFGEQFPQHALCYHYRHKRWWIERFGEQITSATIDVRKRIVYLGSQYQRVLAGSYGLYDGVTADSGTLRGAVETAGPTWLGFASSTQFEPSAGHPHTVAQVPVVAIGPNGETQERLIVEWDTTTRRLSVDHPWITMPDATWTYQVGGIVWEWKSGWFRFAHSKDERQVRGVDVTFDPQDETAHFVAHVSYDRSATPNVWRVDRTSAEGNGVTWTAGSSVLIIDNTKGSGFVHIPFDDLRVDRVDGIRYVAVGLEGVSNGEIHRVYEMSLYGVNR